jgi:general L-amino acid transport system permease protein
MSKQGETLAQSSAKSAPKVSLFYDPKVRGLFYQVLLLVCVVFLIYHAATNAIENLQAAKIASGFGFLTNVAGFDIGQRLISYSATSTYGRAFVIGLLNTLLVASIGVVLATFLGFLIGVARLSSNWIIAKISMIYVEVIRNIPLLLQLLFWYNAVLTPLPQPRDSVNLGAGFYLNNRGLFTPHPIAGDQANFIFITCLLGIIATFIIKSWARKRQETTGAQFPVGLTALLLILIAPALVWIGLALGGTPPVTFDMPEQQRFNLRGGLQVYPEFVALLLGLVLYTAAFIAEVVRAGILAVSKGQTEAARSLGLKPGPTLKLVVIPQAMRVIVPPLTSQYLNLTKNSTLAVVIGYPDLVQVFAGTVLNQTGQALEVIAITMAVYLTISLVTSAFMNSYNRRVAIVER